MIKSEFFHSNHKLILIFLFILIFIKFFLNSNLLLNKNYADQIYNKKVSNLNSKLENNRDWGPIFFESYKYISDNKIKI